MGITLFTHPKCFPCKEVKKRLAESGGKLDGQDVELVDISTDKGFDRFNQEVLAKGNGTGVVPSAYRDGQQCRILHDHNAEKLRLDCPEDEQAKVE